jgi:hypothetical protein
MDRASGVGGCGGGGDGCWPRLGISWLGVVLGGGRRGRGRSVGRWSNCPSNDVAKPVCHSTGGSVHSCMRRVHADALRGEPQQCLLLCVIESEGLQSSKDDGVFVAKKLVSKYAGSQQTMSAQCIR